MCVWGCCSSITMRTHALLTLLLFSRVMFDVSDAFSVREFRKLIASDPKDNQPKVSFFFFLSLVLPCLNIASTCLKFLFFLTWLNKVFAFRIQTMLVKQTRPQGVHLPPMWVVLFHPQFHNHNLCPKWWRIQMMIKKRTIIQLLLWVYLLHQKMMMVVTRVWIKRMTKLRAWSFHIIAPLRLVTGSTSAQMMGAWLLAFRKLVLTVHHCFWLFVKFHQPTACLSVCLMFWWVLLLVVCIHSRRAFALLTTHIKGRSWFFDKCLLSLGWLYQSA